MTNSQQSQASQARTPVALQSSARILQRTCACGQHTIAGGECDACGKQRLQRRPIDQAGPGEVPPIVHDVLRSPGRPLDTETRAFFEPRFAHDFSNVRLHTDTKAAASAQAVNASAYTVGRDVVFGGGLYAPGTREGQKLLAHELAHVVQQRAGLGSALSRRSSEIQIGEAGSSFEREAESAAQRIMSGHPVGDLSAGASSLVQRAEVAGCKSPTLSVPIIGQEAHKAILGWCAVQNPPCTTKTVPGASSKGTGKPGYADLFVEHDEAGVVEFGEIKPRSQMGDPQVYNQLFNYIANYQLQHPGVLVKPMDWVPMPPQNGGTPFLDPQQYLYCAKPVDGFYFYWCEANKLKDKKPITVPALEIELIRQALEKLREKYRKEREKYPTEQPEYQPSFEVPEWVKILALILLIIVIIILLWEVILVIGAVIVGLLLLLGLLRPVIPIFIPPVSPLTPRREIGIKSGKENGKEGGQESVPGQGPVAASSSASHASALAASAQQLASIDPKTISLTPEQARKVREAGATLATTLDSIEGQDEVMGEVRAAASEVTNA